MPHRRAAWLTTPSHPFVLVFYGALVFLGLIVLFELQDPVSLREVIGDAGVVTWALGRIAAGALAFGGAVTATLAMLRAQDPRNSLWWEFAGVVLITLVQGLYALTLLHKFGPTSTLETQGLTWAFALAGLARALTIPLQIVRWQRAKKNPRMAAVRAEPHRPER